MWLGFILLMLGILNLCFTLILYYFDIFESIYWGSYSIYFTVLIISILILSIAFEAYHFKKGQYCLVEKLKAKPIQLLDIVPEEMVALKMVQQLADKYAIKQPSLYVLSDEVAINAFTVGCRSNDFSIILTWGALQNLDEKELLGLIIFEFQKILTGEVIQNTRLKLLCAGFTLPAELGITITRKGLNLPKKYSYLLPVFVVFGGVIWLFSFLGLIINRLFKFIILRNQIIKNDDATYHILNHHEIVYTLLRIQVHPWGSQIYNEYAEAISHLCFVNPLASHNWFSVHPKLQYRIYRLNPLFISENEIKKRYRNLLARLFYSYHPTPNYYKAVWHSPFALPTLRLNSLARPNDEIKPLNPEIRRNMQRPELIQRALQTPTGSREVIVAIFMIRQYKNLIPKNAEVSYAIVETLQQIDTRYHVAIFYEACEYIQNMPLPMARKFLNKLSAIIQADGKISILDVLLLDYLKQKLNLLEVTMPTALQEIKPQLVQLFDALLCLQQLSHEERQIVRTKILSNALTQHEFEQNYVESLNQPIDLACIFRSISGLLLRERLGVLTIVESCLWSDHVITQDELDILQLLYDRFGFEFDDVIKNMQKKNSLLII